MGHEQLYFGCGDRDLGHHWWTPGLHSVMLRTYDNYSRGKPAGCPYDYGVDGGVQPATERPNRARIEHRDGWTCLAWWDRTVDTRPASCSAFVAFGTIDYADMLALLADKFPWVARRTPTLDLVDEPANVRRW